MHHGTFEIVTFIVISESRRLQISSLSSPSLMKKTLQDHINIEASILLNENNITRRLKQKKPFELVIR
jgi:hypothetical protein